MLAVTSRLAVSVSPVRMKPLILLGVWNRDGDLGYRPLFFVHERFLLSLCYLFVTHVYLPISHLFN